MKRAKIEASVAGLVEKLEATVSLVEIPLGASATDSPQSGSPKTTLAVQPTPTSSPGHQEVVNPPDRGNVGGILMREGASKGSPSTVAGTSKNAGTFVVSTRIWIITPGCRIFRRFGFADRFRILSRNMRCKKFDLLKPVKSRLSNDWMGKLRDWGTFLLPEGCIVRFG